ncbi:MAG: YdiU family protein, partial [Campylobacterota bacterium]|nr:YdiU family protein [Campylobacterota bacterium]
MKNSINKFDTIEVSNPYLEFDSKYYDYSNIQPLKDAVLASYNTHMGILLGLDESTMDDQDIVDLLNGKYFLKNSQPYSMVYAGHQFGYFVPQLGDGRAINLGSIDNWHLQLKGSGQTKYSRQGDGRAVLRSSIREYLMSEAMHGLGIATTRALAIVSSKQRVYRQMDVENAAMVLRVSPSWIRIGTFEYFYTQKNLKDLTQLADFVIAQNYPHLQNAGQKKYEQLFFEVVDNTAQLIAQWQAYGFMHGVMNTDNMSMAGVTIDYGPFAFMDIFAMDTICNHTDREGRYSYENQPLIAQWNLSSLVTAFEPLVQNRETLDEMVAMFLSLYKKYYYDLMNLRLGLDLDESTNENHTLIKNLLIVLQGCQVDYNVFFRRLSSNDDAIVLE